MKRIGIRLLCCVIPSRKLRRKIRKNFKDLKSDIKITDHGKNNTVEFITADGTVRSITDATDVSIRIRFDGDNNHIKLYEPLGRLSLHIDITNNVSIILHPSIKTRKLNILKTPPSADTTNKIVIGKNFSTTDTVYIDMCRASGDVWIGNDCMFSWNISIRTGDSHTIYDINTKKILNHNQNVIIGDHVWCGSDVTLLKGTHIPHDCIIGTHSVITKKFHEPNCILVGIPARIVKNNISWQEPPPIQTMVQ